MNCRGAQKAIITALASSESAFPEDLDQHLRDCDSCCAFYTTQTALFRSIDSHLRPIANEPVPRSLLPGVRARLLEQRSPRPQWISTWGIAAIAALVVFTAAVRIQMRHSGMADHASERAAEVVPGSPTVNRRGPADRRVPRHASQPSPSRFVRRAGVPAPSTTPEVLVLREEQEAYAHFVTELSKDRDSAIVLTSAAAEGGDAPVEIALLTIKSVEVKPLEGSGNE